MESKFDPFDAIPREELGLDAIEDHLLFSVFVANKPAGRTRAVLNDFLSGKHRNESPLAYVRRLVNSGRLKGELVRSRCGQYTRIGTALREIVDSGLDLRTCSPGDLEKIHGIGMKTSRFFITYSRPKAPPCAVLDTHVLRWMREMGKKAPKSTPKSAKEYERVEREFLELCQKLEVDPRNLDFAIWSYGEASSRQRATGGEPCRDSKKSAAKRSLPRSSRSRRSGTTTSRG